ncbi:MAG: CAP domain-containing protein, partial [Cocleimonas sp.]
LYKAAYEHSQDMTETNTFSHEGSGTVSDWSGYSLSKQSALRDRVATYGYSWSRLSENISAGTSRDTAQEAVDSWLASDGHCKNMMDPNVTEVGMAISTDQNTTYTNYWTQNFGRPR